MSELLLDIETEESEWEFFEYGMKFGYKERKFRLERDPVIQTIAREIPAEALGKGFKIIDKDGKEIKGSEAVKNIIMRQNDQFIDAVSYDRALTHGLLTFTNPSENDAEKDVFIKAYMPESFGYGYDPITGQYEDSKVLQTIIERNDKTSKIVNVGQDDGYKEFKANQSIHVATMETDTIGLFKGYIDSLFDDAWGYYITSESATLFVTTAGPGIKVYELMEKDMNDEERRKKKTKELRKINGKGSIVIIEIPTDTNQKKPEFKLVTGNPIDFEKIVQVYLGRISMRTKIPVSRLKGLEPGQLAAGEINQASYFDVLEEIQFQYKSVYIKAIEIVADNIGFDLPDFFDIEYEVRKSLTEFEQAELLGLQIGNFMQLHPIKDEIGLELKDLQDLTDIKYKINEATITAAIEKKDSMAKAFQQGESDKIINLDDKE